MQIDNCATVFTLNNFGLISLSLSTELPLIKIIKVRSGKREKRGKHWTAQNCECVPFGLLGIKEIIVPSTD